jgi:hypothetical protein
MRMDRYGRRPGDGGHGGDGNVRSDVGLTEPDDRCLTSSRGLLASPANVSGAEGPERIAPAATPSQGVSRILPGGIHDGRRSEPRGGVADLV